MLEKLGLTVAVIQHFGLALALSAVVASAPQHIEPLGLDHMLHDSVFWPAFLGAGIAALFSIRSTFTGDDETKIAQMLFLAFLSVVTGFTFAFYAGPSIAAAILAVKLPPWLSLLQTVIRIFPPGFWIVCCGAIGEKFFTWIITGKIVEFGKWLMSFRPGGGR